MNNDLQWFSVRCIFFHDKKKSKDNLYEERILIWKANDFDHAIYLAEQEAENYAQQENCKYLGLFQAYQTYFDTPESGVEVFSLMRDDDSPPDEYLDFYFDTGTERQKKNQ